MNFLAILVSSALIQAHGSGACSTAQFDGQVRKDVFLPYNLYPEVGFPDPNGARIHLVATLSGLTQPISSILINGQDMLKLQVGKYDFFDWGKHMYDPATAQLWIAFHSRNQDWISGNKPLQIQVTDSKGNCVTGSYVPVAQDLAITWITPYEDTKMTQNKWIMHVHNYGSEPHVVNDILFSSNSVAKSSSRAFPILLKSGEHAVISFTSKSSFTRGNLFTSVVKATSIQNAKNFTIANGGRVPDSRFPIEVWPRSADCPIPSINDTNWNELKSHGIDTVYYSGADFQQSCHSDYSYIIEHWPNFEPFYVWTDPDTASKVSPKMQEFISAIQLGDENDGDPNAELVESLQVSMKTAELFPNILTYQGGKTNRHMGEFAGITDIQGVDAYIGGCAPAIIENSATLHLQHSYAYLKNARDNHMPLPSISYSQLYWKWSTVPSASEIILEMGSVLASGSKGMTLFQSYQPLFESNRADWDGPIKNMLLSIANPTVRNILRTGDIQGLKLSTSEGSNFDAEGFVTPGPSIMEIIRNDKYIMVVFINSNASGFNYLLCHVNTRTHWNFSPHTVQRAEIDLGSDVNAGSINVASLSEVVGGKIVPVSSDVSRSLSGNQLILQNIELQSAFPVRIFLIPYTLSTSPSVVAL
jgi:hypothetical protein